MLQRRPAEHRALAAITLLKGLVDLRKPLIDPHRRHSKGALDEEVRVLVEHCPNRLVTQIAVDGDEVDVLAALEVPGHFHGSALESGLEWPEGSIVGKDEHDDRCWRGAGRGWQRPVHHLAELFE